MNNAIQFLNKSVLLSICLHLIGVGIASLSIVGTPDKYGDAIIAEFVSLPKAQKTLHTPRQLKTPERHTTRYNALTTAAYPGTYGSYAYPAKGTAIRC